MDAHGVPLLLADDDQDDCLLFGDALEELGIPARLTVAQDGEELMELLSAQNESPWIIFLDLNMPRMNGFECLVEIRSQKKWKDLPVIVYSTSSEPEAIARLQRAGATHYIRKPAEFSKLKKVLSAIFDGYKGGRPPQKFYCKTRLANAIITPGSSA